MESARRLPRDGHGPRRSVVAAETVPVGRGGNGKQHHGESRGHLGVMPKRPRLPARVERKLETTLTEKFKTDVRMLPQSGPLEGQAVDTARGRHETGLSVTLLGNRGEGRRATPVVRVTSSVRRPV